MLISLTNYNKEQEKLFLGSGWGGLMHQMLDSPSRDEGAYLVYEQ